MAEDRNQLLSKLRNNLAIASRVVGHDQSKASSVKQEVGGRVCDASVSSSTPQFDLHMLHNVNLGDVDMRHSDYHQLLRGLMPEPFSKGNVPGFNFHRDEMSQQQRSMFGGERMNIEEVQQSATDVESEDRFLYGAELDAEARNSTSRNDARSETLQNDILDKINLLLHSIDRNKKQPKPELESGDRPRSNLLPIVDYPTSSLYQSNAYGTGLTKPILPSPKPHNSPINAGGNNTSEETWDKILKTIGLDSRLSDMVEDIVRKDADVGNERPFDIVGGTNHRSQGASQTNQRSSLNQIRDVDLQNSASKADREDGAEQFLVRISGRDSKLRSTEDTPRLSSYMTSLLKYSEKEEGRARGKHLDMETIHSPKNVEDRPYLKAQRLATPPRKAAAPPPRAPTVPPSRAPTAMAPEFNAKNLDPLMQALNESLSNIKLLEEAMESLEKSKRSLTMRSPDSQRDALMSENVRMQKEIKIQLMALKETAGDVSEKIRDRMLGSTSQRTDELRAQKDSKMIRSLMDFSARETSPPRYSKQMRVSSIPKKNPSRSSTTRDQGRDRSRSKSQKRNSSRRTDQSRHRHGDSRSRSRSRSSHCGDSRSRSQSRDRRRSGNDRSSSRDRRGRSRDRNSSRKDLGYEKEATRKTSDGRRRSPLPFTLEERQKKVLEMALSFYLRAEEYYNGSNIWCQKCDVVFADTFSLCRHLHSEAHQMKIDPDFTKQRPTFVPVIPKGVASAPARGYEFVVPLQAFFCSLCCEFSKDIDSAEEHIKTMEHNNKFKQFLKENPDYELKFLKDMTTSLAKAKSQSDVIVVDDCPDEEKKKNAKKGFLNPENSDEFATTDKSRIKFAGSVVSAPVPVRVPPPASKSQQQNLPSKTVKAYANVVTSVVQTSVSAQTRGTGGATATWTIGSTKTIKDYTELTKPKSLFSKWNSPSSLSTKFSEGAYTKMPSPSLDTFSSESSRPPTFLSSLKLQQKMTTLMAGKTTGVETKTSNVNTTASTKKSEAAVINISDFEVYDEC